jgi:PAS domain S-box-containing protein
MKEPGKPANEVQRLDFLESCQILDTAPESTFDRITDWISRVLGVPIALVSLVDADRQWFKSRVGLEATQTPRSLSFCGHVVADGATLVVEDATSDERFADNPLVLDAPHVRFYAGAPLRTREGLVLGTLCAIDTKSRSLSAADLELLEILADQVTAHLEARAQGSRLAQRERELESQRAFFQLSLDLLCTITSDFRFELLNPVWHSVLGWTLDELRESTVIERIHPADLKRVMAEAERLLRDNATTVGFETRFAHKDGRWIDLSWVVAARYDRFYCVAHDMTLYRQNERSLLTFAEKLRSSEMQLRSLLHSMSEGVLVQDIDGKVTSFNRSAERILDWQHVPNLGVESADEAWHAFDAENRKVLLRDMPGPRTLRSGQSERESILRVRAKDGRDRWVSVNTTILADDAEAGRGQVLSTLHDITAQVEVQEKLQVALARQHATIDSAMDAIVTIDDHGIIEQVNPATERLFGYESGELVGTNVKILMPAPHVEKHDEYVARFRETGERKIIGIGRELVAKRKNGTQVPVELGISEYFIGGRQYFTGILRDISERKQVERLQSQFISTVSHELRTPLTAIRGSLALVLAGATGEVSALAQEYLQIALTNSERLIRLINELLDLEKLESGQLRMRMTQLDMAKVVAHSVVSNESFARSHGIELEFLNHLRGGAPALVLGDEDRLIQVLTNLISNAVKFSPPSSTVRISLFAQPGRYRVEVRDQGPGLPLEFRPRLFTRFAQADASNTRQKGGTGLGLAISKDVVEKLGGSINFSCPDDGGTIFWFELDAYASTLELTESASVVAMLPLALICEEDSALSDAIVRVLASMGIAAHVALTPGDARSFLAHNSYKMLTIDAEFGEGSARALVSEIRRGKRERDLPIVATSKLREVHVRQIFGVFTPTLVDIVQKPFAPQQLFASLRQAAIWQRCAPVSLLHVEPNEDVARAIADILPRTWNIRAVATSDAMREALVAAHYDVALIEPTVFRRDSEWNQQSMQALPYVIYSQDEAPAWLSTNASASLVKSSANAAELREVIVDLLGERLRPILAIHEEEAA